MTKPPILEEPSNIPLFLAMLLLMLFLTSYFAIPWGCIIEEYTSNICFLSILISLSNEFFNLLFAHAKATLKHFDASGQSILRSLKC